MTRSKAAETYYPDASFRGMLRREAPDPYEFRPEQWPDWRLRSSERRYARRRKRGQVIGTLFGLAFIYLLVHDVVTGDQPLGLKIATLAAAGLYAAGYVYAVLVGVHARHRTRVVIVVLLFVLGVTPAVLTGDMEDLTFLTYALVSSVMMLPPRASRLLVFGAVIGQILAMWLVDGTVEWGEVWILLCLGLAMTAFMALIFTVAQLRAARGEIQSLAVAEERERLARDLHDIIGHSLTTITVKAGLARRMLEREDDTAAATTEVTDVEELARQALTDIRATVSNYRTASLPAEVAGARMSLQAAQIRPELPHAVDDVDPGLREVFGYVVREAVTNVIRHSGADRCEVRLGRRWIEVVDNGRPAQPAVDAGGNGLRGLRERLAAVGGELEAKRCADGGFRVLARVPEE